MEAVIHNQKMTSAQWKGPGSQSESEEESGSLSELLEGACAS